RAARGELRRRTVEELRVVLLAAAVRRGDLGGEPVADAPRGRAGAGEERGQAPEVLLCPGRERVVVALGTAEAHAEQAAADRLGDPLGHVPDGEVEARRA